MANQPVNNPPAPVIEEIKVAWLGEEKCKKLKADFNIRARKHKKGAKKTSGKESHHIMQEKAMKKLISKYSGFAVLLNGGRGGEHDIANASQIARNCPGGGVEGAGPKTIGELQKAAKEDLVKALKGKRANGKTLSKKKAEQLADCLVVEAAKENNKAYKKKKGKNLKLDTKVSPVKGCFPADTLVWISPASWITVKDLTVGNTLISDDQQREIIRTEECFGQLVEIDLGDETVRLASYHRLRLSINRFICVADLMAGHILESAVGPRKIDAVRMLPGKEKLYTFGFAVAGTCRIGRSGFIAEVQNLGDRVSSITII